MFTFKQFLNESRTKGVTVEAFAKWADTHCKDYMKTTTPLYRGFMSGDAPILIGSSIGETKRKSVGGVPNNYTLWIDGHPTFKDFPKRSTSFIASSKSSKASDFGHLHLMFCRDDDKVGAVLAGDIWVKKVLPKLQLAMLNECTEDILKKVGLDDNKNYFQFQNSLQHVRLKQLEKMMPAFGSHRRYDLQIIIDAMEDNNWKDMYDVWNGLVKPDLFGLTTGAHVNMNHDGEVWVEGEAGFIALDDVHYTPEDMKAIYDWLKEASPPMAEIVDNHWNTSRKRREKAESGGDDDF